MADEKTSTTTQGQNKSQNSEATHKIRLVAKSYLQRVPGSNPVQYRRRKKGDVFSVTADELAIGNDFKKSFEEVDG